MDVLGKYHTQKILFSADELTSNSVHLVNMA